MSRPERHLPATQRHSWGCSVSMKEMRLAMMGSMETSMVPASWVILALVTTAVTFPTRQIVQTVRSLVHRVSFHWVVPTETNRNSPESEIAARES